MIKSQSCHICRHQATTWIATICQEHHLHEHYLCDRNFEYFQTNGWCCQTCQQPIRYYAYGIDDRYSPDIHQSTTTG